MSAVTYISIGNSDDKLSQFQWSLYYASIHRAVESFRKASGCRVHGAWVSDPISQYQNACWAVELPEEADEVGMAALRAFRNSLTYAARQFSQDSIAWAVAPTTQFLGEVVR